MKTQKGRAGTDVHDKVQCLICSRWLQQLPVHLKHAHGLTVAEYHDSHPGASVVAGTCSKAMSAAQERRFHGGGSDIGHMTGQGLFAGLGSTDAKGFANTSGRTLKFGPGAELPVFVRVPETKEHIPEHDPNYQLNMAQLRGIAWALAENENTYMAGPTGCGKTSLINEIAALTNWPVRRFNCDGDLRKADIVGEKIVKVDEASGQAVIVWNDGILPQAQQQGAILLVDEYDAMPAHIAFVFQSVLEDEHRLVLTGDGGRVVKPHPNFRIVVTSNTLGQGDGADLYGAGTNVLNISNLNRFGTTIQCDYLPPKAETRVVVKKGGVGQAMAAAMVEAAGLVRTEVQNEGKTTCLISTRNLISWARKVGVMGVKTAAELSILNQQPADERAFLVSVMDRVFGSVWANDEKNMTATEATA